jgi:hypothetical protein
MRIYSDKNIKEIKNSLSLKLSVVLLQKKGKSNYEITKLRNSSVERDTV